MALDLDYFLKINNTYGTTSKKDTQLYNIKNHVNDRFADTIDFYTVTINEVNQDLLIVRTADSNKKTIKARPNEDFEVGDYVVLENQTWLITAKDTMNQVYTSGTMQLCNYTLKFQSPDGTILSYPCIDETSSGGVDENKLISVGDGTKRIKLPFDDNTKLIVIDRRFFIDKSGTSTYKVTNVNNTEFNYGDKGLIVLTVQADAAYNPNTDKNGVCNYFEPSVSPTPSPTGYTLTIASSSNEFNIGTSRTLTPVLKDSLGNEVATWTANWSVNYNGMNQSYFNVTYVGNKCVIEIFDTGDIYDYLGNVLELTCTFSGDTTIASYSGVISI